MDECFKFLKLILHRSTKSCLNLRKQQTLHCGHNWNFTRTYCIWNRTNKKQPLRRWLMRSEPIFKIANLLQKELISIQRPINNSWHYIYDEIAHLERQNSISSPKPGKNKNKKTKASCYRYCNSDVKTILDPESHP